jgi:chitosanase
MLTDLQKKTAQAIVNIFETGRVRGEYGRVTLLPGDTGHLTYGRSQTTLASGNLHLLIKAYCDEEVSALGAALRPYLARLAARDLSLDADLKFRDLLTRAGTDPVMKSAQDRFFDRVYWAPSVLSATSEGLSTPLGVSVVYDSCIHGSWKRMRDSTISKHGTAEEMGEKVWVERYVKVRRAWLAGHANALLHKTVYRMDVFLELIGLKNWTLKLPLRIRGVVVDVQSLGAGEPVPASAAENEDRVLMLRTPRMKGKDIRRVQASLVLLGFLDEADGVFGPKTAEAVRRFQRKKKLKADGIVGPATLAALGV